MTRETIEELTERRDLLKEIAGHVPSEDERESIAEYVSNLTALASPIVGVPHDGYRLNPTAFEKIIKLLPNYRPAKKRN